MPIIPVIGMGLTVSIGSNKYIYTIVSISVSGKSFKATKDIAIRIDNNGMSDCQDYQYAADPKGELVSFRLGTKTNRYKCRFGYASLGVRRAYHDFNF